MDNPQKRRALALRVRPSRCPYCGAYASMNVNSWPIRYIIYSDNTASTLRVPVFECVECGRMARVLPRDCQPFHQHSTEAIKGTLESRIRDGRYRTPVVFDPSLMRRWHRSFRMQAANFRNLLMKGERRALEDLPDFSIQFHNTFRTIYFCEIENRRGENLREFSFVVCLDPG